ncbi:MAG: YfiR family protein [Sphingobium sp.]|nr:YfiR family protein [Sphingobium sp.]
MPTIGRLRVVFSGISLLLAASFLAAPVAAQPKPLESQVKAAFFSKFAAYVNWPPTALATADEPIQLCIIGRAPFGAELEQAVIGQHVDLHTFVVRRLDGTAGAATCHIAFLSGSPKQSVAAMQDGLRGKPILTVTDASLGDQRGMVHFVLKDGRVRFYIDDAMAAQSNLTISARLLSLAISVKQRAPA